METSHLVTLAEVYGAHVGRSLNIVARRAGQHNRLFDRLKQGLGCNVNTLRKTAHWFDTNWPADLQWPVDVPRPSAAAVKRGRAA